MIAKKVADKELGRWNGLDFRPTGEDGSLAVMEIRDALALASTDSAHCKQIVTEWLKRETKYPKPAQIYALGEELRERTSQSTAPNGCDVCERTGWQLVHGKLYDYVRFCSCGLGMWRRQKEQERMKHA